MRRLLGWALIIAGCAALGWALLTPMLSDQRTAQAQAELSAQVPEGVQEHDQRGVPVARGVRNGEALATIRIPRFGARWRWVAVEGTDGEDLARGPGHYAGTPLPGQAGNVALAAHRAGHGDPFLDFDRLRPGDEVRIEQGRTRWVYVLDSTPRIIAPEDVWVIDALRGRRLTLTTCWPRYGSSKRMYVRGSLAEVDRRGPRPGWRTVWTAELRPR